ncbi:MAG: putative conserved protein YjbJ, UPF0337 family [Chloroflexi bacterium AL-N10]|nr:putative conserved protein YjbJ, UPF0337 family [Chloroflexi bacterium AL-N10]NOK92764.1 putative conserved protein YjbJ, UPF0337 family [Chloroflexi bacterium AL-N15]
MKSNSIFQKLKFSLGILFTITAIWTGMAINFIAPARAMTISSSYLPTIVAMDSNPVDDVFGSGTTDKIQGKAQKDIGTVQKNMGKAKEEAKGTFEQSKGRAKQDIGEVKGRLDEAGSDLEEASGNAFDAVKSLFGK